MIPQAFFRQMLEAQRGRAWRVALGTAHQGAKFDRTLEPVGEGYAPGGLVLPPPALETEGRKLFLVWPAEVVWPRATVAASHCAIYDEETLDVAVSLDFGKTERSQNGPFRVTLPRDAFVVRV